MPKFFGHVFLSLLSEEHICPRKLSILLMECCWGLLIELLFFFVNREAWCYQNHLWPEGHWSMLVVVDWTVIEGSFGKYWSYEGLIDLVFNSFLFLIFFHISVLLRPYMYLDCREILDINHCTTFYFYFVYMSCESLFTSMS